MLLTKLFSNFLINRRSKITIILGFCAVFMLISTVITVSYKQLARLENKQDQIQQTNSRKEALLTSMQYIIRERTLSMFAISLLQDPFDRDEEFMRFNSMAGKFVEARLQLETMNLSLNERQLLERIKAGIRKTAPLQDQIVEGLVYGQTVDVQRFMDHDMPMELELLSIFNELGNAARQTRDSA